MDEDSREEGGSSQNGIPQKRHQDGGWGWIVVIAAFFLSALTDGIVFSFGVLFIELVSSFGRGKGETAWIGSLAACTSHLFGPVNSLVINRYGSRRTAIVGSLIAFVGLSSSFFITEMYQLYFCFGIVAGYGFGMMYMSANVCVIQHFEKKRSLASGLASCGSGVGTFIFSPLSNYLIEMYGWRGAVLIEGALVLNGVFFGSLLRPVGMNQSLNSAQETLVKDSKDKLLSDTGNKAVFVAQGNSVPKNTDKNYTLRREMRGDENGSALAENSDREAANLLRVPDLEEVNQSDTFTIEEVHQTAETQSRKCPRLLNLNLLRNPVCILYMCSGFIINLGFIVPMTLLADWAVERGFSLDDAVWLVSALAICNTTFRFILGYFADKFPVNRALMFRLLLVIIGVLTLLSPLCSEYWMMMAYACIYGCLIGGFIMLYPVVLADVFGADVIADIFGLFFAAIGLAALISSPIGGWIFDKTGSYNISFIVAGLEYIVSGGILFIPDLCEWLKPKPKDLQTDI